MAGFLTGATQSMSYPQFCSNVGVSSRPCQDFHAFVKNHGCLHRSSDCSVLRTAVCQQFLKNDIRMENWKQTGSHDCT